MDVVGIFKVTQYYERIRIECPEVSGLHFDDRGHGKKDEICLFDGGIDEADSSEHEGQYAGLFQKTLG